MADSINWHPNGTPGPFVVEEDPFDDHAVLISLPGRAGQLGVTVARCEHNWNNAHKGERRISWKEAETNARAIAEVPAMVEAIRQYRSDMLYPPAADSRERRVAMIDAILARIDGHA